MANNSSAGDNSVNGEIGGGAGPFGIGGSPGVRAGETAGGMPQSFGPQISQHGSGAEVRTAPELSLIHI